MRIFGRHEPDDPLGRLRQLQARVQAVANTLRGYDSIPAHKTSHLIKSLEDIADDGQLDVGQKPRFATPRIPIHVGETELLVHGECHCGWRMAAPEGSLWPFCPVCGERVLPPQVGPEDAALRSGYVAELMAEQDAVAALRRLHGGP